MPLKIDDLNWAVYWVVYFSNNIISDIKRKILKAGFTFSRWNYSLYNRLASQRMNRRVNSKFEVIPWEQNHHVLQFSKEELL